MPNDSLLGPWVRRFLLEHLVGERNLAPNTQRSYRDTLRLLIPFASDILNKQIHRLEVEDISADLIRQFLQKLEEKRGCAIGTRNQRLAAIHSLAQFIGLRSPEHIAWCGAVRTVPFKKNKRSCVSYLDRFEMDAILDSPDDTTAQGYRDHSLLLFLYNTGTRADEAAQALVGDLSIGGLPGRDSSSVLVHGKGNKTRQCPLWVRTVKQLEPLIEGRSEGERIFLNRRGQAMTRFGVHATVCRHAEAASLKAPSIAKKKVSPHTIRHTTAMHLLKSGVDINTIRAWLGHVSLNTTNIYAEADLEMKAKALATCEIEGDVVTPHWREDTDLMEFLRTL